MIPTVFILAAGNSSRFGGNVKQLADINGEPLIRRTIRLVREFNPDIPIYIVTFRKELQFDDCLTINTVKPTGCVSQSILFTEPRWGRLNVFLVGDGVFYQDTLNEVLSTKEYTMFGKRGTAEKPPERFALVFSKKDRDSVIKTCIASYGLLGFRGYCLGCYPKILWLKQLELPLLLRKPRDVLVFNILQKIWNFYELPYNHIYLTDNTQDIDTPEDYEHVRASFQD